MNVLLEHTQINYAVYFSLKGSKEQEREEMILEGEVTNVLIGVFLRTRGTFFFVKGFERTKEPTSGPYRTNVER